MASRRYRYSKKAGALQDGLVQRGTEPPIVQSVATPRAMMRQALNVMSDDDFEQEEMAYEDAPIPASTIQVGGRPVLDQTRANFAAVRPRPAPAAVRPAGGLDPHLPFGRSTMFFYTVEEGQRVQVIDRRGKIEVVVGPRRLLRWGREIRAMAHYVAHPGEFLIVRFRDGTQEHHTGPAHCWFDPRIHFGIEREEAVQISAKEAVVVYSESSVGETAVSRRIVHGPATFVPEPGEWLHTFRWHGPSPEASGFQKVPGALVFQKLWLMPDQMYHDVARRAHRRRRPAHRPADDLLRARRTSSACSSRPTIRSATSSTQPPAT